MSLAAEYAEQAAFRAWDLAFDRLPLRPGERVLDLGCAIGHQARMLAARGARVTGLDGNAELLAAAGATPGVDYQQVDLATWEAPALAADGLWSSFTAAYFPDFVPVLKRWIAAVKPGGWVALVEVDGLFAHRPLAPATRELLDGFVAEAHGAGRYDFRMGRMITAYARAAGLAIVQEVTLPDQELAASGPLAPAALAAWERRLDRMAGLQAFAGERFPAVRAELLAALASPAHVADAKVRFVLGRKL